MMGQNAMVLVFAPNPAGEQFVRTLSEENKSFAALACSPGERERLQELGVMNVIDADIKKKQLGQLPINEYTEVYFFEEALGPCCELLELIRQWTHGTIYIITKNHYPQLIYKALGADFVIRTTSNNHYFLLDK
ncbi:hypothetical protein K3T49_24300 [Paenibacillus sonchi]|nr:hypothetical protein [Paenibacillus sonchi]